MEKLKVGNSNTGILNRDGDIADKIDEVYLDNLVNVIDSMWFLIIRIR